MKQELADLCSGDLFKRSIFYKTMLIFFTFSIEFQKTKNCNKVFTEMFTLFTWGVCV